MENIRSGLWQIRLVGRTVLDFIRSVGRYGIFLFRSTIHMFSFPFQPGKTLAQLYFIGAKSIFIICLTGAFTGMVLGFQGYYTLVKFGSVGLLGPAVGLTLIRELGPALTAIMVTGRAGSAIAAEIGIMRISEQIDALKTMNINPVRFLVSPKLLAGLIAFPLLTAIFDVVGIFGGYLTGSVLLGINPGLYFSHMDASVNMEDIAGGFIKSFFFSVVVISVCCYKGYYTHKREVRGAKGVSDATTDAVVYSCVLILACDYVLTSFLM